MHSYKRNETKEVVNVKCCYLSCTLLNRIHSYPLTVVKDPHARVLCLCRTASLFQQIQHCTGLSRSYYSAMFPALLPHLSSTCPAIILILHFTSALVFHLIVVVSPLHLYSSSRVSLSWKYLVLRNSQFYCSYCKLVRRDSKTWNVKTSTYIYIYAILPKVLGHRLLMKGLTTLIISMGTIFNV